MWPIKRKSAEELDSILYFLSSALTSVIDENSYLVHHRAALPQIGAGLATAEIASRLAVFRQQVCDVSEREFAILTKLARARHWGQELRRYEPHLRADIDAFLAATKYCETMARERTADAQSLFDGHAHPKRFLADRVPGGRVAAEAALSLMERLQSLERGEIVDDESPSYLIGGEVSVEALNDVCETLLARLAAHYGWAAEAQGLPAEEASAEFDEREIAELEADEDPPVGDRAEAETETAEPEPTASADGDWITEAPEKTEDAVDAPETKEGDEARESEEGEKSAAEMASVKDSEVNYGDAQEPASDKAVESEASSEPGKTAAASEQAAEADGPPRAAPV